MEMTKPVLNIIRPIPEFTREIRRIRFHFIKIVILIFNFLIANFLFGQVEENFSNVVPVSPNAHSIAKYGEYPVKLNTGLIDISVPLFEIRQGDLEIPIQLSYHSSGIKIDELASWVGLGWTLQAGGAITRAVKGIPDDKRGATSISNADDLDPEIRLNDHTILYETATGLGRDNSSDYYFVSFPGGSAKFLLDPDNNDQPVVYSQVPFKINRIDNSTFEITDQNGVLYRFGTAFDGTSYIEETTRQSSSSEGDRYFKNVKSTWYLTEIVSADKADTVYLKYTFSGVITKGPDIQGGSCLIQGTNAFATYIPGSSVTYFLDEYVLDRIDYMNGSVRFLPAYDRLDLSSSARLDKIIFYGGSTPIKSATFHSSYYTRTGSTRADQMYSLKLNKLTFSGFDGTEYTSEMHYDFIYNNIDLPYRGSFAKDYWGYYNGASVSQGAIQNDIVPFNDQLIEIGTGERKGNGEYTKAGSLARIIYPTGGYTDFEFAPHKWESTERRYEEISKSVSVNAVGYPTKGEDGYEAVNTKDEITFTPQSDETHIVATLFRSATTVENKDSDCGHWGIAEGLVMRNPSNIYTYDGKNYVNGSSNTATITLTSGTPYTLSVEECGYGNVGASNQPKTSATISWQERKFTEGHVIREGGGLRIKSVTNYNKDESFLSKKKYSYNEEGIGTIITQPNYFQRPLFDGAPFILVSSYPMGDLGTNNGSPVEYTKVVEKEVDELDTDIGKIVYYYESTPVQNSFPELEIYGKECMGMWPTYTSGPGSGPLLQPDPSPVFSIKNWSSGLLKKVEYWERQNNSYFLSKEFRHLYTTLNEVPVRTIRVYNLMPYSKIERYAYVKSACYFYYFNYEEDCGIRVISETKEIDYQNDEQISKITTFDYNDNFLLSSKKTIIDEANFELEEYYYPDDINLLSHPTSSAIGYLGESGQHRIAEVILRKNFRNDKLLEQQRFLFHKEGEQILLTGIETANPDLYIEKLKIHRYSDTGNPVEVSRTSSDLHSIFIWGYNDTYVIAKVENVSWSALSGVVNMGLRTGGLTEQEISNLYDLDGSHVNLYDYAPGYGMTSRTDPNGITTYYEYDDFGRLVLIKDNEKHILQQNEYNYGFK